MLGEPIQITGYKIKMATTIESKKVVVAATNEELFAFALDLNNFEKLLPEGRIKNFESDGESCSFEISGMATLGLRVAESEAPKRILLKSEKSPFPFTLEIHIGTEADGKSTAYQVSQLDVNAFMKAMVQKPLTNLFDYIADRLVIEFENN